MGILIMTYDSPHQQAMLTPPNPPSPEAIKKAQFVDKTFVWNPDAGNGSRKRRTAR